MANMLKGSWWLAPSGHHELKRGEGVDAVTEAATLLRTGTTPSTAFA
jgi:hypothetical protein